MVLSESTGPMKVKFMNFHVKGDHDRHAQMTVSA